MDHSSQQNDNSSPQILENLCEACLALDFSQIPRAAATSVWIRFGTLTELLERETRCQLCFYLTTNVRRFCPEAVTTSHNEGTNSSPVPAVIEILMQNAAPQTEDGWPINEAIWLWFHCLQALDEGGGRQSRTNLAILRQSSQPIISVDDQITEGQVGGEEKVFARARLIGRHQANPRLFTEWLRLCDSTHPRCEAQRDSANVKVKEFWLVDVRRACVLRAKAGATYRYTALSYVWGRVNPLRLGTDNKDVLQAQGVLRKPEFRSEIPQTIQDAMDLTASLNIDYLWVDTLCIPQDDIEIKQEIMQQMHLVYRNAVLTIVAAAGEDSNRGLPGIQLGSRDTPQSAWKIRDRVFLGVDLEPIDGLGSGFRPSRWRTRAWTYEEALFSDRMLVFTDQQVYWYCPQTESGGWREDTVAEMTDPQRIDEDLEIGVGSHAVYGRSRPDGDERFDDASYSNNWAKFRRFANQYSGRELTRPYDALNAFLGIANALREGYSDFFWGIPEVHFAYGLCWYFPGTIRGSANHKFRGTTDAVTRTVPFPSWCWANWRLPDAGLVVPQWQRSAVVLWGVQFRGTGPKNSQRCTRFCYRHTSGKVVQIKDEFGPPSTVGQRDPDVNSTSHDEDDRDQRLPADWKTLRCHTQVAQVFVRCLEHRHMRDLESFGAKHKMMHEVDKDSVMSLFALHDASGNFITASIVTIDDDRGFLINGLYLDIEARPVTAIAIISFTEAGAPEGVMCLLAQEDEQGYFHRIGLAQIYNRGSREILVSELDMISGELDIPPDAVVQGWEDIDSSEKTVYLS